MTFSKGTSWPRGLGGLLPTGLLLILFVGVGVTLGGCRVLRVSPDRLVLDTDWTTEGGGEARRNTAGSSASLRLPLEEAWSYNANAGFGRASALRWSDILFVPNRRGEVHAVDLDTGKKISVGRFGDAIEGTPALSGDVLIVPVEWGGAGLQAVDVRTGETVWSIREPGVQAGLLIVDDLVVAAGTEGTVRGIEVATGDVVWEVAMGSFSRFHAAPVRLDRPEGDWVLLADDKGRVAALRAESGALVWETHVPAPVYETPALAQSWLYVPTAQGAMVALNPETGQVGWTTQVAGATARLTAPAVGAFVFVASSDGTVAALDKTDGRIRWRWDRGESFAAPPLVVGVRLVVGGMDETLYVFETDDGTVRWQTDVGGRIKSPMLATEEGLVVLAETRDVYYFKPQPSSNLP